MRRVWSTQSLDDRNTIIDYLAEQSPRAALRLDAEIERQTDLLLDFPFAGRSGKHAHTRELVISTTPYVIVYSVESEHVLIVRVLHSAQEWPPNERRG